jgi:hypothetical protein
MGKDVDDARLSRLLKYYSTIFCRNEDENRRHPALSKEKLEKMIKAKRPKLTPLVY